MRNSLYSQQFLRYNIILKLVYLVGIKLGHWPQCQKLHIYPISTPRGQNWAYFCFTGSGFRDMLWFQIAILGHEICMAIGQSSRSCTCTLFLSRGEGGGRNLAYFRSTDSSFRDTGQFSKLPYLGMKLGHWSARSCTYTFYPRGQNCAYFCSTGSGF